VRSILSRVVLTVAGIATVTVLFRAVSVVSRSNAGWEVFRDNLVAGLPPTLQSHSQADDLLTLQNWQWILAQADRLLADRNASAADFAGGAIAITSAFAPPPYARQNTTTISRTIWGYRTLPPSKDRPPDDETIRLFRKLFSKMRSLAKMATEVEPGQKDWWRLRALLAGNEHNRSFGELADPDAIVQGAAHDPDNALYDYLHAFNCIEGAYIDLDDRDETVLVDGKLLMQAWSYWMNAIRKPFLATGIDRAGAAADFIQKRTAPITMKLGLIRPEVHQDIQFGLVQAIRAPYAQFYGNNTSHKFTELMEFAAAGWFLLHDPDQYWNGQLQAGGETWGLAATASASSIATSLAEQQFISAAQTWRFNYSHWQRATSDLLTACSAASIAAAAMAWLFVLIAIGSAILAWLLDRCHPFRAARIRTWIPILLWLLIFGATFSSLGLLLSYQPTVSSISTPVLIGIIAGVASVLVVFAFFTGRFVLRQGRLPRIERSLFYNLARLSLIVLAVVTVIFPLICVSDGKTRSAIADSLDQFPRNVLYHLRVRGTTAIRNENIADAWMQWGYHGGLYWTVGFWLGALFLIYAARAWSSRGTTSVTEQPAGGRHKFAMVLRQLCKSALLLTFVMFVLYVLVSTVLLDQMQALYDRQIARFADPNWMTKEIEAEIQKLALPPPGSVDNSTTP
jgi:hypothetical protein